MANKVVYATGIDYVSGSLSKPIKKSGHSHGTYLIGTHRVAASQNPNCKHLYVKNSDAYTRTAPLKQEEIEARSRFAAVRAMVKTRSKDLTKITADQAAFEAQKNSAYGKKTMLAWYWKVCGEEYDESLNG